LHFAGFCFADARGFVVSLDNIKEIKIESNFVELDSLVVSEDRPNPQILKVTTEAEFKKNIVTPPRKGSERLAEFPKFPEQDYVEMSVWM
ncbi:hypothetical protein PFISCL1PPCAC_4144, partial [Pristionchus fissidentatus]